MTKKIHITSCCLLALVAVALIAWVASRDMGGDADVPEKNNQTNRYIKATVNVKKGGAVKRSGKRQEKETSVAVKMDTAERNAISILSKGDAEKEKELTSLYAKLLASLSEDQKKVARMRLMINADRRHEAIRTARDLMDSNDPETRKQVVGAFRWYGGAAGILELSRMFADVSPEVQSDAMEAWQSVFDGFSDDSMRAETLIELIPTIDDKEQIDALLMNVTKMRARMGLETVSEVIESNPGAKQREAALEMWDHLTDNYQYRDASSVDGYLTMTETEQREAVESWNKARDALVAANGDVEEALRSLGVEDPKTTWETFLIEHGITIPEETTP